MKTPESICGPYELFKGNEKTSYCIMDDDTVSVRKYVEDAVVKTTCIQKKNLTECLDGAEAIFNELTKLGYKEESVLGKRVTIVAPKATSNKVRKSSISQKAVPL